MSWHTHESMNQFDQATSPLSELISETFSGAEITNIADAGHGRGVFSQVIQVQLEGAPVASVVVKAPATGANGEAARRTGSYSREAFAYRNILSDLDVRVPHCYAVHDISGDPWFVLEDLCDLRQFDQLEGLTLDDCLALTESLATLHQCELSADLARRTGTRGPADFELSILEAGLESVAGIFGSRPEIVAAFTDLLTNRTNLVSQFAAAGKRTFCHGDPRADNAVASPGGPILLDWQQITMSFGETDLAWLLSTSVPPNRRAAFESAAIAKYAELTGVSPGQVWENYRLGLVRPGLAVLMLTTRESNNKRIQAIIDESLVRIASAIVAHDVASL